MPDSRSFRVMPPLTIEQRVGMLEVFEDRQHAENEKIVGELRGIRLDLSNINVTLTTQAALRQHEAKGIERWGSMFRTILGAVLIAAIIWFAHMAMNVQTATDAAKANAVQNAKGEQ